MSEYDLQDDLNTKLKHYFDGKIVRKDLTKYAGILRAIAEFTILFDY